MDAKNSADAIEADQHEIRATHNSFLRHDRTNDVAAAAEILMSMRHGPPNAATTICRRERTRDKVSIIVRANTTGKKQIRFRWSVATNYRNAKIYMEVTMKEKITGRPCIF